MYNNEFFNEVFGKDNIDYFLKQYDLQKLRKEKLLEFDELRIQASNAFDVDLKIPDIILCASVGVLSGLANALFKDWVPQKGKFAHKHGTTRTAVDYQIPKPPGYKGSVQNLHRQLGPSHDIFRFKETLGLMSGNASDFNLWGETATKILGHGLNPVNVKFSQFLAMGGFKIPMDPRAELGNHLLIDFFTKRSLPLPGSTFLADSSPEMAKVMIGMYDKGLNLKNFAGNSVSWLVIQFIIHGYSFLFKAVPESNFEIKNINQEEIKNLFSTYWRYTKSNEFHVMMIIAHGASFLVDTAITASSKGYAGIFQLNYMSLMSFAYHLLRYLTQSIDVYKDLLLQASNKSSEIYTLDVEWNNNFRKAIHKNLNHADFLSIFDIDEWERNYKIIKSVEIEKNRRDELLEELKEEF